MSAVSRQFGDVVQEIEGSSAEKQSEFSFDADRLMKTTKACRAVLKDIKASVSLATGRVATDPDYLKRAVEMSPRERVAYGLTETDLRLVALRVDQGTTELRLQKEQLVQQMVFLDPSSTDPTRTESDVDFRQRERELSILVNRLENMELMMSRFKDIETNPHRANDSVDTHHVDLDRDPYESGLSIDLIPKHSGPRHQRSYSRVRANDQDERDASTQISEESETANKGRNIRMRTEIRGSAREAKQLADQSKARGVGVNRSDGIEKNIDAAYLAPDSRSHDASEYIALQCDGFVQAMSSLGATRMWTTPASQEELSQLVIRQRSQWKDFSTLTNYRLLNHDLQDSVYRYLEVLRRDRPDLEWTIQSIDIRKGRRTHLSRWRRQKSEQAQIILSGRPLTGKRDPTARSLKETGPAILADQQPQRWARDQRGDSWNVSAYDAAKQPPRTKDVEVPPAETREPRRPLLLTDHESMDRSPFQRQTDNLYDPHPYGYNNVRRAGIDEGPTI
ncbi:MAG: hypothetical protein Q9228_005588 [Teloschistes exilis]